MCIFIRIHIARTRMNTHTHTHIYIYIYICRNTHAAQAHRKEPFRILFTAFSEFYRCGLASVFESDESRIAAAAMAVWRRGKHAHTRTNRWPHSVDGNVLDATCCYLRECCLHDAIGVYGAACRWNICCNFRAWCMHDMIGVYGAECRWYVFWQNLRKFAFRLARCNWCVRCCVSMVCLL